MFAFTALGVILGACASGRGGVAFKSAPQIKDTPRAAALRHFLMGRLLTFREKAKEGVPHYEAAVKADPESSHLRLQLAAAYERVGRKAEAEAACKEAIRLSPTDDAARLLMGRLRLAAGDKKGAEEALRQAIKLRPKNEAPYLALATLHLEDKRLDKALSLYHALIKAVPTSSAGYYRLARHHREQGQIKKAEQYYRKTIDISRSLRPLLELAFLYEEQKRRPEAIALYREAFELAPGSAEIVLKLVELYLAVPDATLAEHYAGKLRENARKNARVRMRLALAFHNAHQYKPAARELESVIALDPKLHRARYYLGATYAALKSYPQALKVLAQIPEGSTVYPDARTHIGFVHREAGQFADAQRILEGVVAKTPKNVVAQDLLASVLEKSGKMELALQVLERALNALPSNERLLQTLALYLEKANRFDDAVLRMREVLKQNPKSASAMNFIGYGFADRGINLEEAESLIRQALDLKPGDGYILDSLGWVLFKKGSIDEAEQTLERARALAPKEAAVLDHLGDLHHKRGNPTKARDFYRNALSLNPDAKLRRQIEEKLRALDNAGNSNTAAASSPAPVSVNNAPESR